MLESIHIHNFVLIDRLELDFGPGLNVLTGETGSGKSIVIGALNLVLGARASSVVVREGAERAKIDAVFSLSEDAHSLRALLSEHEIELDGAELILTRTVTPDGRSRAYVGGQVVPLNVLAQIGDELVDLHGQHEHQSLLKTEQQLILLDAFARCESQTNEVRQLVTALRNVERSLAALEADDRERARRADFLRFALNEINAAALVPGEEEQVKSRRNLITNAENVASQAERAYTALYESEEHSAHDRLAEAGAALEELAGIDPQFVSLRDQADALRGQVEELARDIRGHTGEIEFDPVELESLNQRIAQIGALRRKYGDSVEAILAYRDQIAAELDELDRRDERLAELARERDAITARALSSAAELSKARRKGARKLDRAITETLQALGMEGATFETRLEEIPLYSAGTDRVQFVLAANPGEPPRPLKQVASGGEISRVMLAIKAVLADADRIPTLVFDEVDAGVGGAVANGVASKLSGLGKTHQVISITHLPQIAAAAATHYCVSKSSQGKRTQTAITRVEGQDRVAELARLLDGSVSDVSLEHARALLAG